MPRGYLIAPIILIYCLICACAIHPLPEDATGVNTYDIVRKIRCEARHAVKDSAVRLMRKSFDPKVREIADQVDQDVYSLSKIPYSKYDTETRKAIEKYDGTAIAYDFTFTMTENNNVSADIGFLSNLTRGTDALNFKSGSARERQNIRNFRITDTFYGLAKNGMECKNFSRIGNIVYPITGYVGLSEVIETFFALNETGSLSPSLKDKTSLFADTLNFTTTFSGSAAPGIIISPVGKMLSLGGATVIAEVKRNDVHTLIVALSLPVDGAAKTNSVNSTLLPLVPPGKTLAEARASAQIDYQIDKNRPFPFLGGRPYNTLFIP